MRLVLVPALLLSVILLVFTHQQQQQQQKQEQQQQQQHQQEPDYDLTSNFSYLGDNVNGNCHLREISILSTIDLQPSHFYVSTIKPSESEVKDYFLQPDMLTKSNSKLRLGLVKGRSVVHEWMSNKGGNSWQLDSEHPRNNKQKCMKVTNLTSETAVEIYSSYKEYQDHYVIRAVNAFIHETGIVALPCGYYQPLEGCETLFKFIGRKWWNKCKLHFKSDNKAWPVYWRRDEIQVVHFNHSDCLGSSKQPPLRQYKRVLVIAAMWDNNYHHFIIDSLSRLVRHLDFLRKNPDVVVHIRGHESTARKAAKRASGPALRARLLQLLDLDPNRFVAGPLLAEEVFVPRAVKCNYPLSSALEIRLLASHLIRGARSRLTAPVQASLSAQYPLKPILKSVPFSTWTDRRRATLLQRAFVEGDTKPDDWRAWTDEQAISYSKAARRVLTNHQVTLLNTSNEELLSCLHCQIKLYQETDILIGVHGAGLTNMIFMPAGSLVVEIVGKFDGRMLPLCGYHGSLAAVFGIHHYVHYFDYKGGEILDMKAVALEATNFHRFLNK